MAQTPDSRIEALEKRVSRIESLMKNTLPVAPIAVEKKEVISEKPLVEESSKPTWIADLFNWVREDWLMKLGAFLLILALGWFVTYAFANDWIGPVGRITLGIVAGAGMLGFGYYFMSKKRVPGEVFVVTGMVMIILTTFAGKMFYEFFTPAAALGIMALVIALVSGMAVVKKSKSLAILGLVAGSFVPMLVGDIDDNPVLYLSYIFAVDLGMLLVVSMTGWRVLVLLSFIMTAIYNSFIFESYGYQEGQMMIWLFMGIAYALFLISNVAAILKNKKAVFSDLCVAGLNSLVILGWVIAYVPDEWQSMILSGLALISVVSIYLLFKKSELPKKSVVYIYLAMAMLFIGGATAVELQGQVLTIAFSIEVFLAVLISVFVFRDIRIARGVAFLQVIPVLMLFGNGSFDSWNWAYGTPLLNENFFAILISILSLSGTAFCLNKMKGKLEGIICFVLASFFAVMLLWLSMHNVFESESVASGVALVLLTIVGIGLSFYSLIKQKKGLQIAGSVLLGGVVLHLLFIDIWDMPMSGKIVTFVLIGLLLVTTAFFNKKLSNKNKSNEKNN
ncbi:MAG: DUF2339 domain-containing protein [Candidatus Gracilibacteria bacterium]